MIPKHKLGILIAGIKPRDDAGKDEQDDSAGDSDQRLHDASDAMFEALKDDDKDAFFDAVKDLHDCLVDEDKKQDEEDDADKE